MVSNMRTWIDSLTNTKGKVIPFRKIAMRCGFPCAERIIHLAEGIESLWIGDRLLLIVHSFVNVISSYCKVSKGPSLHFISSAPTQMLYPR
jgi:hypothetical protein